MRAAEISPIGEKRMTVGEAREAIETIKGHVDGVRGLLLDLHRREGWASLGYRSFRECIAAEFRQHESYLYRQLSAAEIEAEISPIGEIGRIPESRLRPLAPVPAGERKEVWDEAVEKTGGKPTAKIVEEIVDRKLGKEPKPDRPKPRTTIVEDRSPDFSDDDFRQDDPDADEPENVQTEAAVPSSPETFVVPSYPAKVNHPTSLIEREPGEEDEPEDEKEWLATLPLDRILANEPQKLFRADARIYRRFLPTREEYRDPATEAFGNLSRKGAFGSTLSRLLKADHPKHWHKCPPTSEQGCDGLGKLPGIDETCPLCWGRGYLLFAPGGRR